MELKKHFRKINLNKHSNYLNDLIFSILKSEEVFIERADESNYMEHIKVSLKLILDNCFSLIKENKFDGSSNEIDLNYLKENIKNFKNKSHSYSVDIYFYAIRNSIKDLIEFQENKQEFKSNLYEIIMTVFMLINFLNLSIDEILEC